MTRVWGHTWLGPAEGVRRGVRKLHKAHRVLLLHGQRQGRQRQVQLLHAQHACVRNCILGFNPETATDMRPLLLQGMLL